MGYAVSFFAMNGQDFARRLREDANGILAEVEQLYLAQTPEDESQWETLHDLSLAIAHGEIPDGCGLDWFYALMWLAAVASERVTICPFEDFRHLSYYEEIALQPILKRHSPPFPVPRRADDYPAVGYIPVKEIEPDILPAIDALPQTTDRDVENARDEFRFVLETLVPDNLDLLSVLL